MQINSLSSEPPLVRFERRLEDLPFRPPLWLRGGHLQTLAASLLKRNFSWGWGNAEEHFVDLQDGSRVRLICAWQSSDAPTLVVLHGTGGSSASTYMQGLSHISVLLRHRNPGHDTALQSPRKSYLFWPG